MSIRTRRSLRTLGWAAATLLLGAASVGVVGCNSTPPDAPGPAVGSTTPQGGVITVTPEHGRRPHMGPTK